jgi:hypothetical protein
MAYEIGEATNYKDLLDRLRLFATDPDRAIHSAGMDISELDPIAAQDAWTVKRWDPDWDGNGNYELILSGPGVTGSDGILIGFQTYHDDGEGYYNWCLAGMTAYSDAASFLNQVGVRGNSYDYLPHVFLNNTTIQYWFIGNGRRIAGVAKVGGTYYACFYLGYILPYGTPAMAPYPLMIGGSAGYTSLAAGRVYSSTGYNNRGFIDPFCDSYSSDPKYCSLIFMDNDWYGFGNHYNQYHNTRYIVWPYLYNVFGYTTPHTLYSHYGAPLLDGGHALWPLILSGPGPTTKNMFGEMQGIFATISSGLVTEDTITVDGKTYIVFQNGTYNGTEDHFAILKE